MVDVAAIARAEVDARLELRRRILAIIHARCETGYGRVHRGALQAYVHLTLGLQGPVSKTFGRLVERVIADAGYRPSYSRGYRCYYGLAWRGELAADWNTPRALDIPRWVSKRLQFRLVPPEQAHVPRHRLGLRPRGRPRRMQPATAAPPPHLVP